MPGKGEAVTTSSRKMEFGPTKKAQSIEAFDRGKMQDGTEFELVMDELPHSTSDNNIFARFKGGKVEAFDGHRVRAKIEVEEYNYLKESGLSGNEVREGCEVKLYLDDHMVYGFFHRNAADALLMARQKLGAIKEVISRLLIKSGDDPVKALAGRKVYYRDTPATIKHYFPEQGAAVFEAEEGHKFPLPAHMKEDNVPSVPERESETSVKDDILSEHIWWWRDREKKK